MKNLLFILIGLFCLLGQANAMEEKKPLLDKERKWEETENRDLTTPQLYQSDTYVYVYSEKQLDNLTIGITDMQGKVYYEEVTTVPAGMYYAISIESLPAGTYYLCIYQGSNYVVGAFSK